MRPIDAAPCRPSSWILGREIGKGKWKGLGREMEREMERKGKRDRRRGKGRMGRRKNGNSGVCVICFMGMDAPGVHHITDANYICLYDTYANDLYLLASNHNE